MEEGQQGQNVEMLKPTIEVQEKITEINIKIGDILNRLQEVENVRDPIRANQRISMFAEQMSIMETNLSEISNKINSFVRDDKFIELFTDEEFRELYNKSGLVSKDVTRLISSNPKFKDVDVSQPAISKVVNGVIGNIYLRSFLGRHFRYEIAKMQELVTKI